MHSGSTSGIGLKRVSCSVERRCMTKQQGKAAGDDAIFPRSTYLDVLSLIDTKLS
jgi:hypothetical protein